MTKETKTDTVTDSIDELLAKRSLLQRINAIQSEVTTVAKNANVDRKYDAVTHDDVNAMIRPLMVKHGVTSFISLKSSEVYDTGVMWQKRKAMQLRSVFEVTYLNVDKSSETAKVEVEAWADDAGDKAPGKVMSYAQKYADLKTFRISTGEDDEQRVDESQITEPTLSGDHLAELHALAEELLGDDADAVLKSMAENVFQVKSYHDILDKHFEVAIRKIKSKAESA